MAELDKIQATDELANKKQQDAKAVYDNAASAQSGNEEWLQQMQAKLNAVPSRKKEEAPASDNSAWLEQQNAKLRDITSEELNRGKAPAVTGTVKTDTTTPKDVPVQPQDAPAPSGNPNVYAGVTEEDFKSAIASAEASWKEESKKEAEALGEHYKKHYGASNAHRWRDDHGAYTQYTKGDTLYRDYDDGHKWVIDTSDDKWQYLRHTFPNGDIDEYHPGETRESEFMGEIQVAPTRHEAPHIPKVEFHGGKSSVNHIISDTLNIGGWDAAKFWQGMSLEERDGIEAALKENFNLDNSYIKEYAEMSEQSLQNELARQEQRFKSATNDVDKYDASRRVAVAIRELQAKMLGFENLSDAKSDPGMYDMLRYNRKNLFGSNDVYDYYVNNNIPNSEVLKDYGFDVENRIEKAINQLYADRAAKIYLPIANYVNMVYGNEEDIKRYKKQVAARAGYTHVPMNDLMENDYEDWAQRIEERVDARVKKDLDDHIAWMKDEHPVLSYMWLGSRNSLWGKFWEAALYSADEVEQADKIEQNYGMGFWGELGKSGISLAMDLPIIIATSGGASYAVGGAEALAESFAARMAQQAITMSAISLLGQTATDLQHKQFSGADAYLTASVHGAVSGLMLGAGGELTSAITLAPKSLMRIAANKVIGNVIETAAFSIPQWVEAAYKGELAPEIGEDGKVEQSSAGKMVRIAAANAFIVVGMKLPKAGKGWKTGIKDGDYAQLREAGYGELADAIKNNQFSYYDKETGQIKLFEGVEQQLGELMMDMGGNGKGISWDAFRRVMRQTGRDIIPPAYSKANMKKNAEGKYVITLTDSSGKVITEKAYEKGEKAKAEKDMQDLEKQSALAEEMKSITTYETKRESLIMNEALSRVAENLNEGRDGWMRDENGNYILDENGNRVEDPNYVGHTPETAAGVLNRIIETPKEQRTPEDSQLLDMYRSQVRELGEGSKDADAMMKMICERYGVTEEEVGEVAKLSPKERKSKSPAAKAYAAYLETMRRGPVNTERPVGIIELNGETVEVFNTPDIGDKMDFFVTKDENGKVQMVSTKEAKGFTPYSNEREQNFERSRNKLQEQVTAFEDTLRDSYNGLSDEGLESEIKELEMMTAENADDALLMQLDVAKRVRQEREAAKAEVEAEAKDEPLPQEGEAPSEKADVPEEVTEEPTIETEPVIDNETPSVEETVETPTAEEEAGKTDTAVDDAMWRKKAEAFVEAYFGDKTPEEKAGLVDFYSQQRDFENTVNYDKQDNPNDARVAAYENAVKAMEAEQPAPAEEVAKPSQPAEQAGTSNTEKPLAAEGAEPKGKLVSTTTDKKGRTIETYVHTEEENGYEITKVDSYRDGKKFQFSPYGMPMPEGYRISEYYIEKIKENGGEIRGLSELRVDKKTGEVSATVIVKDGERGVSHYEVKLEKDTPQPVNDMQPAKVETEPKPKVEETPVDNSQPKDRIDELLDAMGFEGDERAEQRAFYEDKNNAEQFEKDYKDFVGKEVPQPKEEVKAEDKKDEVVDNSQQEPEIVDDLDAPMPMKKTKKGREIPDFDNATVEQTYNYLYGEGSDRNRSDGLVENTIKSRKDRVEEAQKALGKAKAKEQKLRETATVDDMEALDDAEAATKKADDALKAAQADLEKWEDVQRRASVGEEERVENEENAEPETPAVEGNGELKDREEALPDTEQQQNEKTAAELEKEFNDSTDEMSRVEQEWDDKIKDYVAEKYPTQATVTAETNSPIGKAERAAMNTDPEYRRLLDEQKRALDEAEKKNNDAYNAWQEALKKEGSDKAPEAEKPKQKIDIKDALDQVGYISEEISEMLTDADYAQAFGWKKDAPEKERIENAETLLRDDLYTLDLDSPAEKAKFDAWMDFLYDDRGDLTSMGKAFLKELGDHLDKDVPKAERRAAEREKKAAEEEKATQEKRREISKPLIDARTKLLEAYKSGDKKAARAAQKEMTDALPLVTEKLATENGADPTAIVENTIKQMVEARKKTEKGSAEYKTADYIVKALRKFQKDGVKSSEGRVELNAVTLKDPVSRDYLNEIMEKEGWGEEERKEFMRMLDDVADVVLEMGKRFPRLDDWNKREIASDKEGEIYKTMWRILNKKGQWIPNRSAFKKNGEYPWNIDLGTLCTKRESFDALVQLITEKGLAQNLGPTQIEGIKELLKSNGFLTACDICFNETKRARVISYANQVSNNWRVISEALGIKDKMVGDPIDLTPEQVEILNQMAGRGYKGAFKKYIPEDQRREYKGEEKAGNEIDLGLTPAMMQKIAKQMLLDPTLTGKLKPETLITTEGMDWLLRTYGGHTKINELLASAWGSGTPKPIEGFNIYDPLSWREQYDQNRPGTKKRPEIGWFFNNGGFRAQSFTDYHPMLFLDYLQMFTDLGVRRLPIHIYTKVPALVKLFGGSGAKINMSLVPKMVDGVDAAHAGLKPDGKGGWEYAWDTDSFPIDEAFALRQDPRYGGNVGTIAVGLSDAHIRMMLADPTIDQVIPYHKSGMPESVQIKTGLKNATDYTDVQTTGNKPKGAKDFNFNEAVRKYGDPRRAAEEYVKWCEKNGYAPKFEQFKDDPNYYKLLADFRLFDGEGKYSEQKAVNPRNILQEGWETELENSLTDKTMQEQVKAQVGSNENLMKGVERLLGKQRIDGAVREEMVARLKGALGKDNVESLKQNDFFDALEDAYSKTMGAEKAHEKVEVLRTNDGVVYGFAQGGKIVLNENVFNAETPIHEFTHIWVKVAQRENPKLWKKGKELLKQSEEWKEVKEDELYKDIHGDEDAVASEVLARIVGRDGADYVRRLLDPDSKPLKRGGVYNQIREWLNDLFKSVRSIFAPSIRNLTFDEFKKMPLNTLFDEAEAKRFLEAKNRLEKEGTLESDVEEMGFAKDKEEFDEVLSEAVKNEGIVLQGLSEKEVKVVKAPDKQPFNISLGAKELKKQVKDYAKTHGDEILGDVNVEGGVVHVSIDSVGEMADPKSFQKSEGNGVSKDVHFRALLKIKEILENSIDCEIHPDYREDENHVRSPKNGHSKTTMMHVFYGAVDIGGKEYSVRSLVKEQKGSGSNKAYMYSLEEIALSTSTEAVQSVPHHNANNTISLANIIRKVRRTYGSKDYLLAESEKSTFVGRQTPSVESEKKERPVIFTANKVLDPAELKRKYPSELPNKYYDHSTNKFGKQPFDGREGERSTLKVVGRLTTDKVDALVVENPNSENEIPHITLATAEGVKPVEANSELQKHRDEIVPLDDTVETEFYNDYGRGKNARKVELQVESGNNENRTVDDANRDYAAEMRELMRRRLRGEDVTAELEQLRADRRAAEAARNAGSDGAGSGEPPVEPPTPPVPATPEPAPELPPTGYERPTSPIEMAQEAAIKAVADTKASLEQRNAARRELTASLRNIHKAMGLQKEYDRATVENVVNLCKMMVQSGLIDRSYVSNLTPLFTKLKGATGKQDLTSTVNDIMDVMLKSQERSVRNEIAKLLNTKGTKVDQNGVVTQAGLDIRGQHTMKELSEYMGKGSVIIDNHISKLEEERAKIPDGHQERIDDIDDKILGSQLAKQYSQIEETHSVNIREAEEDLNFLKERYKAGEIGVKEYTEQKHALENLIRSYRMAQTDALWNQANAMRHVIAGGKEGTRNWIEQQKERKNEIRHNAYSDMEGTSKRTQGDPTAMQKIMNSAIPKFFSSSLYTLQTMLKSLGNKHAMGEGYLYNRFFRGWMEQRDAEITEYRDDMKTLNSKAKELTGHSYFGIYNMIRKLPKMTVEYVDGGEMVPHELDQGQLGYAYMVNKMEDGAAALRNMGITEEKMQEISNFLDPKLKEFYDWLQDDFLAGKWDGMNEVHRRMFGADMDRVANYIPLRRDREAGTQEVDISQENEQPLQSTVVGSIIQRVHSNLGIDLKHNNAIDVVANHLLEATHWKHFSEWKRDANTLLSDTTFRNKVKNSTTIYGSGDVLWNRLNQVFQIAGGDYKPKAHSAGVDKAIVDMARTVNTAKVSLRVFTAAKQLLSLPVFATECNTATLLKNLGFLLSPVTSKNVAQNSFLWCLQNLPQFRERWVSRTAGETRLENGDLGWGYSRQKVLEAAGRIGLTPNAFIDVCTVAAGAKSIYEKRYAQYKKDGYSEEAAAKKAKIDAETAFNESQQSSEKAFVSPIQVDRTAVALGLSTFRNASMGFERKFMDAIRNFRHLTDHKDTVDFMKKQMERDGLTETQAKSAAERLYRRALWRSTLNFLMFGFGAQMAWNVGGKLPYLIFGDDDEEKKKMVEQAAIHAGVGGWIEGLPAGDMLSEGMTNWAMNLIESGNPLEGNSFFEFDPDLLTVTSDFVKMTKAIEGKNPLKGATDFLNLLGQIYTGVNPQTLTDAGVAIYDACDGKPEVGNEALMCILRILQCPQSQLDQMYIDELKMSAREAQKLTPEEVARRYAYYKAHKDAPYMWWMYNQNKKDEIVKKYEGDFYKKLNTDVKEEGGTAEDYHDLMESATTKKKHDEYKKKEIDALAAQGPEALMKAWDKEHAKGASADYKYMRTLMSRYQKEMYGEEKMPSDSDAAYEAAHGEDLNKQAEKIGRDFGFEAQDSYYQMSQTKTKNSSANNKTIKEFQELGGSFRYTENGEFLDMDEYNIKLPVKDKAKRTKALAFVEEHKPELQRIYRNGWRMKRIASLYKELDKLEAKRKIALMSQPTQTMPFVGSEIIYEYHKEISRLLDDEAGDRDKDNKSKKK